MRGDRPAGHPSVRKSRSSRAALLAALVLATPDALARDDELRYVVQPGDNPWNLTTRYLRDIRYWPRIQALNQITEPTRLRPGTVLRISSEWLRLLATGVELVDWSGDVTWTSAVGPARQPAFAGARLTAGSSLRTGAGASASLRFDDGSRILVLADSELVVSQADRAAVGGTLVRVELVRGELENVVTARGPGPGRFEIRTPAAVAGVRGTEFRVRAADREATSEVLAGLVDLGNATGRQALARGFGSRVETGRAPIAPVALLPAPDLAGMLDVIERLPFERGLPDVPGGIRYRTQASPDARFGSVSSNEVRAGARLAIADVPDGPYVVRVRAIDANGLEGFAAERSLRVHARPEPPLLVDPPGDALVVAERPTLRWTGGAKDARYRVRVSRDDDAPVLDASALEVPFLAMPDALAPGTYRWRVATIDRILGEGPFSDPQRFQRVLPGPGVDLPPSTSDPLDLRWRATGPDATYRLQLARDDAFTDVLVDTSVDVPRHALPRPAPGDYRLRVATRARDGVEGPWGPVQTLTIPADGPPLWPLLLLLPFLLLL